MSKEKKPSVKRISEVTGFSVATVSNALNMKKGVNKETAARIFQAAEEMGYSLSEKGLTSIKFVIARKNGAILDDSPFHMDVIEGVEQEARENGLSTLFIRLNCQAPDYAEQVEHIVKDSSGGVILLASELLGKDFEPFQECKCPLILLDGWSDNVSFDGVLINNQDSAERAVNYLIQQGHKKIGYIRGDYRIRAFQSREQGYWRALNAHGLEIRPEWAVTVEPKIEVAYQHILSWLDTDPELPTAFFADNDLIAYGAIRAFTQKGIHVPDDISIIGFDDLPYSVVSRPPLTTIHVHKQDLGREAVRRLLGSMKHRGSRVKLQICTDLIVRESVRNLNL